MLYALFLELRTRYSLMGGYSEGTGSQKGLSCKKTSRLGPAPVWPREKESALQQAHPPQFLTEVTFGKLKYPC